MHITFSCFIRYVNSFTYVAPTGPPRSVHVLVLNSTAVEVQWNYPYWTQRNGIIRGFKVFVQESGSATEQVINVANRNANELIVDGLLPATLYTFSVLAYTVNDGPRSIHLTVSTFSEGTRYLEYSGQCCMETIILHHFLELGEGIFSHHY